MQLIYPSTVQEIIAHGISRGADFVDIFIERTSSESITYRNSRVEDTQSGISFGVGIRLIQGHQALYGHSNSTDRDELLRVTDLLAARLKGPRRPEALNFERLDYKKVPVLPDQKVSGELKTAKFREMDQLLRRNEKVVQVVLSLLKKHQYVEIFNSEGLHASEERPYIRYMTSAVFRDGAHQSEASFSPGAIGGWSFMEKFETEKVADELLKTGLTMLYAKPAPAGKMPVVIDNGFGGVIFHEACGHLLETTSVEKKASVFWDKKGQQIAHSAVTALDDGTIDEAWGSLSIDDEGTPTQRTVLIENGILKNFISDRLGEKKTGHARTGSGRRQSYKFAPASRMRNTFIAPGPHKIGDLFAGVDRGIYAKQMGGGSVDPSTGQFNFAVREAYLIENGKITTPVKGATLIGTGSEVLTKISMVADNLELMAGMCGSVSGSIPTTVGQPAVKVDEILVGGEA
jgi:TldD protein